MAGQKMTKSQFVSALADKSGLTKKQAGTVIDSIFSILVEQLNKKGPGEVTIPGMLKVTRVEKPAVPEHTGVNPFTKQPTVFKAKPASRTVKAKPVKALKDAI